MSAIKKTLRQMYRPVWRTYAHLVESRRGTHPVAYHGIQRSGTNFLRMILEAGDYKLLNGVDPARNDPRHKHFRWQPDKATIVMDEAYRNDVTASTVKALNEICGYQQGMPHLVLYRPARGWMDAIFRWGVANEWFASEEEFIERKLHRAFLAEWHAYYAAWEVFAADDPNSVLLLDYAEFQDEPGRALSVIDAFAGITREEEIAFEGGVGKVRHSRPMDAPRETLSHPDVDAAIAEGGPFTRATA